MRMRVITAALVAGLAGPVSAATVLDFTANNDRSGTAAGVGYEVTATDMYGNYRTLSDSTHHTNKGCTGNGWDFACDSVDRKFDVGFGVQGTNDNEIDGKIRNTEFVQVTFDSAVRILGFAGMLTYDDSWSRGTETVILHYSSDDGLTWNTKTASAIYDDNDHGAFGTVGLAFRDNLNILANVVRFTAGGRYPYDDRNTNVTAAGLIVAPVPVPASLPLLVVGLGALGFAARRKRKSA